MFFRQVLHDDLGCASYVVADAGEAAVIDPKWDIADYLELAEEHGFAIRHILETHNHADHVSGHGRLARGDRARRSTCPPTRASTTPTSRSPTATRSRSARFGSPRSRRRATARSTWPSWSRTRSRGDESWLAVTGDSLFVGDLARPDLAVEAGGGRACALRLAAPAARAGRFRRGLAGPHRRLAVRRRRNEPEAWLDDRVRAALQPLGEARERGRLRPRADEPPRARSRPTSSASSS